LVEQTVKKKCSLFQPWHKEQADSTGIFALNEEVRIDGDVGRQWKIKFRTVKYLLNDLYFNL
jgi:hypothetical protein